MNARIWEIEYAGSPKVIWSQTKPTSMQLAIAARLGIEVSSEHSFAVVASTILEEVGDAIGCPPRSVSDRQRELAQELKIDISDCNSSCVAFVRIQEAIQLANLDAVKRMQLKPGDRIVHRVTKRERMLQKHLGEKWRYLRNQMQREYEVSSIREDGQVFFKSGGQAPARYLDKVALSD